MPDDTTDPLRKRQEQLADCREAGRRKCSGMDGFGDEVAKPLPVPPKIAAIADGKLKQDAIETWEAASRLSRLVHQWSLWLERLQYCGKEIEFSLSLVERMRRATGQCIRTLCRHNLDSRAFTPENENILGDRFPDTPPPQSYPAWWDDAEYVWGIIYRFWDHSFPDIWNQADYELYDLMERLKDAPSTAFRQGVPGPLRIDAIPACSGRGRQDQAVKAAGYLGLSLDESKRSIAREGYPEAVALGGGELSWSLMTLLIDSREKLLSLDDLKAAWAGAGLDEEPEIRTVTDAISCLRKIIKPLGITIKNSRSIGYRLESELDFVRVGGNSTPR